MVTAHQESSATFLSCTKVVSHTSNTSNFSTVCKVQQWWAVASLMLAMAASTCLEWGVYGALFVVVALLIYGKVPEWHICRGDEAQGILQPDTQALRPRLS